MATRRQISYLKKTKYAAEELKKETAEKKEAIRLAKEARYSDFSIEKLENLINEHNLRLQKRREYEEAKKREDPQWQELLKTLYARIEAIRSKYNAATIETQKTEIHAKQREAQRNADHYRRQREDHKPLVFASLRNTIEIDGKKYFHSAEPIYAAEEEERKRQYEYEREYHQLCRKKDDLEAQLAKEIEPINKEIQEVTAIINAKFVDPVFTLTQGKLRRQFRNLTLWNNNEREAVRNEIKRKQEELHQIENLRGVAAAHYGKQRVEADKIKRGLKKQLHTVKECPYCGNDLVIEDAHADHIYPIAKGGLSTTKNMVFVCSMCNSRKSAMTLREFVIKYKLDRSAIEVRLEMLDKTF